MILTVSNHERDLVGAVKRSAHRSLLQSVEAERFFGAINEDGHGESVIPPHESTAHLRNSGGYLIVQTSESRPS